MTILDKVKNGDEPKTTNSQIAVQEQNIKNVSTKPDAEIVSDNTQMLSAVESQFKSIMQEKRKLWRRKKKWLGKNWKTSPMIAIPNSRYSR